MPQLLVVQYYMELRHKKNVYVDVVIYILILNIGMFIALMIIKEIITGFLAKERNSILC